MFFFEKKNQKTFAKSGQCSMGARAKAVQSFFAAFCSQKDVKLFLELR